MQSTDITIQKAVFTPEKTTNKQILVYLPGFSLSAKSKAVNHLGQFLSDKGFATIAISTTPRTITQESLPQEAKSIVETIERTLESKPFLLVAHSKGASKAIAVLEQLHQLPLAVVLITPVGIYPQKPNELKKLFIKEVKENTLPNIKKEFPGSQKPMLDLALSVLSMTANEFIIFFKKYPKRLKQETEELAINAPKRANTVLASLSIPVVIGYTKNDKVVDAEKLINVIKQAGKNNIYMEELPKEVTHGTPYTHPEIVLKLIEAAISKLK